jgi:deazaflavin-dependent oxidoreductase (nitroreductase family)
MRTTIAGLRLRAPLVPRLQQRPEMTHASSVTEPLVARFYFVTHFTSRVQAMLVRRFRRYFVRAPGWVLLTTRGRRTGLLREVLLPCERFQDGILVISTYDRRSNWIRNIERNPAVQITCAGWVLPAHAEIVDDLETKRALVTAHPYFPPAPVLPLNLIHITLLRPLTIAFLRRWVVHRPVILIRPAGRS